jgi:multidrug resistance protein MdtO
MLMCVTTVSRIFYASAHLPPKLPIGDVETESVRVIKQELQSLASAIGDDFQWPRWNISSRVLTQTSIAALGGMARSLEALGNRYSQESRISGKGKTGAPVRLPFLQPDALTNSRYVRFSLRTLLSVLVCYVFYNAVNWPGIHTIMLTCLVVALPTIGASTRQGVLRIAGASIGSILALFMVAFVIPHTESISDLLLISLPVVALGAWVSAGSERIGYAGIQIMFTFSLALLVSFSPPFDLIEIRDRIVGILLGASVAIFIQTSLWPEGEADVLRTQLGSVLREIAAYARENAAALLINGRGSNREMGSNLSMTWTKLADCTATLSRVALEPDWREGESINVTLLSHTVLAQARMLLFAFDAFNAETVTNGLPAGLAPVASQFQLGVADALDQYAKQLAMERPAASAPVLIEFSASDAGRVAEAGIADVSSGTFAWHARAMNAALCGLPQWCVSEREAAGQSTFA